MKIKLTVVAFILLAAYLFAGQGDDTNIMLLQGGDNVATATPIPALPCQFSGTTIGYINDYDEACPYSGSFAPDVVYSFLANSDMMICISLCQSNYDTKLYVYENFAGALIGCNDDHCGSDGYKSEIYDLHLNSGSTYYIIVDGYANESGNYELLITNGCVYPPPCFLDPPPEAILEDEPVCQHNFEDIYNGGCGSNPAVWDSIASGSTVFGHAGVFQYQGVDTHDEDWYEFETFGICPLHLEGVAEFPLQMTLISQSVPEPCQEYQILNTITSPACSAAVIDILIPAGRYWAVVGPSGFESALCLFSYILTMESGPADSCIFVPGDANNDSHANGLDVVFIINWLKGWPFPPPVSCDCGQGMLYPAADYNGNCLLNGLDVTYAVNYYSGGCCEPQRCPNCPPGN